MGRSCLGPRDSGPLGVAQDLRPEVEEGKWTPLPTVHTQTHLFSFVCRSLSPVTRHRLQEPTAQTPGQRATHTPDSSVCLTSGPREVNGLLAMFLVCVAAVPRAALCRQAARIPFYRNGGRDSQTGPCLPPTRLLTFYCHRWSELDGFSGPPAQTPCFIEGRTLALRGRPTCPRSQCTWPS